VKDQVDLQCPNVSLSSGVLLTGGGSFLNGVRDLGQKVFNVPCTHGKPYDVHGLPSAKDSPLYACHVGAIRYAASLNKPVVKASIGKKLLNIFWGGTHD
jgi:cell division ATPase FtsA